jgi:hypothetical protein
MEQKVDSLKKEIRLTNPQPNQPKEREDPN